MHSHYNYLIVLFIADDLPGMLKKRELVEEIQWEIIEALIYQITKTRPPEQHMFGKIIFLITESRIFRDEFAKAMAALFNKLPDLDYSPLFRVFHQEWSAEEEMEVLPQNVS